MKEISRQQQAGKIPPFVPGTVVETTVRHDDWCMIWSRGVCNCEPTVKNGPPKLNRAERRAQRKK